MGSVDDAFADLFAGRGLAIVTCRDSRIDPLAVFGLEPGDAKILRNAGARVTDDGLRSLALAVAVLGVTRIAVVQHTDCKMASATDPELSDAVAEVTGRTHLTFEPLASDDQSVVLRDDVAKVLESPLIADGTVVAGLVYDLPSGRLTTVVPPCTR